MKKLIILFLFQAILVVSIMAQTVASFNYKLDNGIVVKIDERNWTHEWVQQRQDPVTGTETTSVTVNVRTMGDLTQSTVFKLTSGGKDIKMKDASPGTYDLKMTSKLSGKPGSFILDIKGIEVKPKMKTTVNVTIYNYQINIEETPVTNKGLATYESLIYRYKGNGEQNLNWGIPAFYAKGAHDKKIAPDEQISDIKGKIKPGTYDMLITLDIAGYIQKIWLENFAMKPDINYRITTNLNAGEITYAGVNREVRQFHLYPAGTADKQQGAAKRDIPKEFITYDKALFNYACPPGTYDVLLNIGNGSKFEWRKGVVVRSGTRTDVK
jgi:hypothetical protein